MGGSNIWFARLEGQFSSGWSNFFGKWLIICHTIRKWGTIWQTLIRLHLYPPLLQCAAIHCTALHFSTLQCSDLNTLHRWSLSPLCAIQLNRKPTFCPTSSFPEQTRNYRQIVKKTLKKTVLCCCSLYFRRILVTRAYLGPHKWFLSL